MWHGKIQYEPLENIHQRARSWMRGALGMAAAAALGAGAFLALAGTACAQDVGYMRLTGPRGAMAGESTDAAHRGWIEIRTVSVTPMASTAAARKGSNESDVLGGKTAVNQAVTPPRDVSSGMSSGKRVHQPMVITKEMGAHTTAASGAGATAPTSPTTGAAMTTASTGAGATGGPSGTGDVRIMKMVDKASPLLMQACASGEHFSKVEIVLYRKAGEQQVPLTTWVLTDAIITSFQPGGSSSGGVPTETLVFRPARMEIK